MFYDLKGGHPSFGSKGKGGSTPLRVDMKSGAEALKWHSAEKGVYCMDLRILLYSISAEL